MKIISNSSPLIGLCSIDRLAILQELFESIIIPNAVYEELVFAGDDRPGSKEIKNAADSWIDVKTLSNRDSIPLLESSLDRGEAEVIALGQELNADLLILDNKEPRNFAKAVDLNIIGTVGIIKLAWKKGIIANPIFELYKLKNKGFYIKQSIIDIIIEEYESRSNF